MRTITKKAQLVDSLFQMLQQANPQYTVESSFLAVIGGMCRGLISGPSATTSSHLAKISRTYQPGHPVLCGHKLIELAQSLSAEGILDCTHVWSASRLIRRMVAVLGNEGLRIKKGRGFAPSFVESTPAFASEQGLSVRVRLGGKISSGPVLSPPLNVNKLRHAKLKEDFERRGDEIVRLRLTLEVAEAREANLQTALARTAEALHDEQKRIRQLRIDLFDAQRIVERQQEQLAHVTTGRENPIYRRVGLHEDCPDFALKAVRRAYARELHPDQRPDHQKRAAEERLKEVNAVFDDIYNMRALR